MAHKTILVLGATGRQGGSVARVLLNRGWSVRAFVRDSSKPAAAELAAAGARLARGTFDDTASLRAAMDEVHGVFSALPATLSAEDEVRHGIAIAELAADEDIPHFVYSSGASAGTVPTGIARFDAKPRIEAHVRRILPEATILRPSIFMDMLVRPGTGLDKGRYTSLVEPQGSMHVVSLADIGRFVAAVFYDRERFAGQVVPLASDRLTGLDLAAAFSQASGRPISYARLPDAVLSTNPDLAHMAESLERGPLSQPIDLDLMRAINPDLTSFRAWLATQGRPLLNEALRG
nr:NmrA/HSCARG family protein [Consotaella salsifontis]